ncbi:LysR family transcriptional regulator [Pseudonocardia eucalypti]|uniref:LysR family transcriptional regulator n=1 Tax=Pseudonocardia eucalypti TaxID=648755 RepID=A0ABP9RFP5_9PSEU|nr:DNA-binding transcriptional LysR family regulator [Pseudonocardia eucalypti]
MDVELRHLRCLVAIADAGGFTDAAVRLGVTQPSVSRALAALEDALGVRVLRRTSREVVLTSAGERVLARARRVLAEVDDLVGEARSGHTRLRLGHAWAALGEHTVELQRRWAASHPDVSLHLVRTNTPSGGLAEGACDVAVVRSPSGADRLDPARFDGAVVGLEARYCALAADDPLARRRQLRVTDLSDRVLAIDRRTGTTGVDLWPAGARPEVEEIHDVDDWLAVIASGRCVGVTAEGTLTQYRRQGVVFRPLRDAPPVPVRLVWWRDDPHPATADLVGLLAHLYRTGATRRRTKASRDTRTT